MKRFLLFSSVLLLGAWIVLMLAGAVPQVGNAQLAVFRAPAHVALCGLIALACLIAAPWPLNLRRIPTVFLHLGVAITLFGAAWSYFKGEEHDVSLPVDPNQRHRSLRETSHGGMMGMNAKPEIPLGFALTIKNFTVEFYPVIKWDAWKYQENADESQRWKSLEPLLVAKDGSIKIGDEIISAAKLATPPMNSRGELQISDTLIVRPVKTAKRFAADLHLAEGTQGSKDVVLEVNSPVDYDGWRFHLSSYDDSLQYSEQTLVQIHARREPGAAWITFGIWLLIIAAFAWGFLPERRKTLLVGDNK